MEKVINVYQIKELLRYLSEEKAKDVFDLIVMLQSLPDVPEQETIKG